MNNLKFSILIPTKDRSDLLMECLDCLAKQNYTNFEIIIIDDCSSDNTKEIVNKFTNNPLFIRYEKNPYSIGAALCFKKASQLATGDFLLTFSDDDALDSNIFTKINVIPDVKKYDLIYCNFEIIDSNNKVISKWLFEDFSNTNDLLRKLIDRGSNVIPEAIFIRKDKFTELYSDMYADRFITPFYLIQLRDLKFCHIKECLYKYRIHSDSTFSNIDGLINRNKGVINFLNLIAMSYPLQDIFNTNSIYESLLCFIYKLIEHGNRFFEGTFYTGAKYTKDDFLWGIFYKTALNWIRIAKKYKDNDKNLFKLERTIQTSLIGYNHIKQNKLHNVVYRFCPCFCYMPINNVTKFIHSDIITINTHVYNYIATSCLWSTEIFSINSSIIMIRDINNFIEYSKILPIQSISINENYDMNNIVLNQILDYLFDNKLYFKYLMPLTDMGNIIKKYKYFKMIGTTGRMDV